MQAPKENANPTLVHVQASRKICKALEYPEVAAMSAPRGDEEVARALNDRVLLQGLVGAASRSENVSILRHAGLNIPRTPEELLFLQREPMFVPHSQRKSETMEVDTEVKDPITEEEIYEIIRNIQDPEHPLTLEQLGVVSRSQVSYKDNQVKVRFTPTIPHCSMATLIGLCLTVKLKRSLTKRTRVSVQIEPGTHQSETAVNRQLADKERVCAALENKHLCSVVNNCIRSGLKGEPSA